jgi:hypothetical protein
MKDLTAKDISEKENVPKRVALGWIQRGEFPNARKVTIEPFGEIWLVPENDLIGFTKPKPGPKPKNTKLEGELTN